MSFLDLPTDFPAISKAIKGLLSEPLGQLPDMRSIGEKTYDAFISNEKNLDDVKKRDWRHLPYALWISESKGLVNNTEIVNRYLIKELNIARQEARRPLKWGKPLAFVYVVHFQPNDNFFRQLSTHAQDYFNSPELDNTSGFVDLVRKLNLFDVTEGPKKTAESIAESRRTIFDWIQLYDLWPSFVTTLFAEQAFGEFLKSSEDYRRTDDFINTVFDWAMSDNNALRYSGLRIYLADSLLLPWRQINPTEKIKSGIIEFLLKNYGDPRVGKNLWHGVSAESLKVFISWINGRTLDIFFKILEKTADEIWEYRRKFWTAYFKSGYIDEVWVVLGPQAAILAKQLDVTKQLKFSKLLQAEQSQSVLLIKIGQIVFCEWSHNGKLRAQIDGTEGAPSFYKSFYYSDDLRFNSLDFNYGENKDPGLIHFSSELGGWQNRARLFMQKHTGIRITQAEVTK
jgi:hypothetical protein